MTTPDKPDSRGPGGDEQELPAEGGAQWVGATKAPKRTLRAAIYAMCRSCIYDPLAGGNWRQQVGACRVEACPLWPYRPKSAPKSAPSIVCTRSGYQPPREK